jgi:hypothetical protein
MPELVLVLSVRPSCAVVCARVTQELNKRAKHRRQRDLWLDWGKAMVLVSRVFRQRPRSE